MSAKNKENIEGIIVKINGTDAFKAFLLAHNITIGTPFKMNYSPSFSQLINLTVLGKMISIRKEQFNKIEWEAIS